MARMHNPPHPGEVIKELCLDPLKLTVTPAAEGLGVSRRTLSMLLNGHAGISPDMAIRLSKAFGRSPESWLQLRLQYDLWQAEQRSDTIKVKHFPNAGTMLLNKGLVVVIIVPGQPCVSPRTRRQILVVERKIPPPIVLHTYDNPRSQ
jgi:addiction module HigA family antidote